MTVTRNQRDSDELAPSTNAQLTTQQQPQQPLEVPTWMPLLLAIAQDQRHDLASPVLRYWKAKLKAFPEETVGEALLQGKWEFFPSVDQVIGQIERIQEERRQAAANAEWDAYCENQERADREGLLATEEQYAEMREGIKKIASEKSLEKAISVDLPGVHIPTTLELAEKLKRHGMEHLAYRKRAK